MNPAESARKDRERHPEKYCPKCFWKIVTRDGVKPCPKHPVKS